MTNGEVDDSKEDSFVAGYKSKRGTSGGHKIPTRSYWLYAQKALVRELVKYGTIKGDILNTPNVLAPTDVCRHINGLGERCTSKAEPYSRGVNLCTEHKLERRREQMKLRMRRFRERRRALEVK